MAELRWCRGAQEHRDPRGLAPASCAGPPDHTASHQLDRRRYGGSHPLRRHGSHSGRHGHPRLPRHRRAAAVPRGDSGSHLGACGSGRFRGTRRAAHGGRRVSEHRRQPPPNRGDGCLQRANRRPPRPKAGGFVIRRDRIALTPRPERSPRNRPDRRNCPDGPADIRDNVHRR